MKSLTEKQALALHQIVKYARKNGEWAPTAKKLRDDLGWEVTERDMSAFMQRIERNLSPFGWFDRKGRSRKIDDDKCCTEPESGFYLVELYEFQARSQTGRVSKTDFHSFLLERYQNRFNSRNIEVIFQNALKNKYLGVVRAAPAQNLKAEDRLLVELPYLRLLRSELISS